jgi:large subunit ribosomal protein L25
VSDKDLILVLNKREQVGKGLNQLRRDGLIPGVIHTPGKDSVNVTGNYLDVVKIYQQAGRHHPIDLTVDGTKFFTIIKDVDFEPTKHTLRHVVFDVIKSDEKVETEVPIELTGDAPAGKLGLIIDKLIYHVNIEALPRDLPDKLEVSIDALAAVGDHITVADIVLPKGVTILTEAEHVIAQVEEPHVHTEEEPVAEEVPAEGAEAAATEPAAEAETSE